MFKAITSNTQNRNNSAADCSISLKYGTECEKVIGNTLQMFKVKGQRSRLQENVRHQQ